MTWKKFNGEIIQKSIIDEVESAIKQESAAGHQIKICIGTDSQVKGDFTEFATVIVLLRQRQGGFMYISKERSFKSMSIKERMLLEVQKSIEIAYQLCDLLETCNVDLEVHADINTNHMYKSNVAFADAMGYILSMGYIFKAKPDAFASSSCADKWVH